MPDRLSPTLVLATAALTATAHISGRLGDLSLRDPRTLATLAAMITAFAAVLWAGDRPGRSAPADLALCSRCLTGATVQYRRGRCDRTHLDTTPPPRRPAMPDPTVPHLHIQTTSALEPDGWPTKADQLRAELAAANRDLDHARRELEAARAQLAERDAANEAAEAGTVQTADQIAQAIADPSSIVGPRRLAHRDGESVETHTEWAARAVLAVLAHTGHAPAQTAAQLPDTPAEGDRTDEADHGPQGSAEPPARWSHVDTDGDEIMIAPRDDGPGWIATSRGAYLTPDAAADLHVWLGQTLAQHWLGDMIGQPAAPHPDPQKRRDPHAPIPTEASTNRHPDHDWWTTGASRCLDDTCPRHRRPSSAAGPTAEHIQQMITVNGDNISGAHDQAERAECLAEMLREWYQAWPDNAVADPHAPIAAEIVRLLAPPARPGPSGPQDIPDEWMLPFLREATAHDALLTHPDTDYYRHPIRSAYRLGYAAAMGCEITVSPEGDAVLIGDRPAPTSTDPYIGLDPAEARARALAAVATLFAGTTPDGTYRSLEQTTVAAAERVADWITTGDYDCWPCAIGQHYYPPTRHTWAGPDEVAHAADTGQADPRTSRCDCADAPRADPADTDHP
jgi:hypothetical protein